MLRFLSGLPRSCSSLVAAMLDEHPDVWASGTSALSPSLSSVCDVLSGSEEVQGDLANDLGALDHYRDALRGLMDGWYRHVDAPIVVDKGRLWLYLWRQMLDLNPDAQMVVCVRDPRDVIASIERGHRATAIMRRSTGEALVDAVPQLMGPQGMVGGPCKYIEDAVRAQLPGLTFVRAESFVVDHRRELARIGKALGLSEFDWPDEARTLGRDNDGVTRGKFSHATAGPIRPQGDNWRSVIDDETAARIAASYPLYMQTFGYQS